MKSTILGLILVLFSSVSSAATYATSVRPDTFIYAAVSGGVGYSYTAPAGKYAEFYRIILKSTNAASLRLDGVDYIDLTGTADNDYSVNGSTAIDPDGNALTHVPMNKPIKVMSGQVLLWNQPSPLASDRIWVWGVQYYNQ